MREAAHEVGFFYLTGHGVPDELAQGVLAAARRPSTQEWIDVPPADGAFVVNIGELLEVATGGYLRATEHRVILDGQPPDRISVPYFFNPRLDARIPALTLPPELRARAARVTDPADPIFAVYGRNAWKSRLRAHPDVASAHGYWAGRVGSENPVLGSRGE